MKSYIEDFSQRTIKSFCYMYRNRTKAKLELIGRADMHYNNWSEELLFFIFYFYNHVCLGQYMNNYIDFVKF